jgi:MbtH protein
LEENTILEENTMSQSNWLIDGEEFKVLINEEEQYSLWPSGQPAPEGWRQVGPVGAKEECLAYVEEHWTDLRPKSLRDGMAADLTGADISQA